MPAAEELERICERIECDNPGVARRVARTIYDGCARLKDFPHLGRVNSRIAGRRELVFTSALHSRLRSQKTPLKSRTFSTVRRIGRNRE